MDTVDPVKRSQMMANIRSKNTKPEMIVRSQLHRRGFRYRLHVKHLPGKPDLVLPRHRAVILINGCFWHGHNCSLYRPPKSRQEYWTQKITGNQQKDKRTVEELLRMGWRVCIITECAVRWPNPSIEVLITRVIKWIEGAEKIYHEAGRGGTCNT